MQPPCPTRHAPPPTLHVPQDGLPSTTSLTNHECTPHAPRPAPLPPPRPQEGDEYDQWVETVDPDYWDDAEGPLRVAVAEEHMHQAAEADSGLPRAVRRGGRGGAAEGGRQGGRQGGREGGAAGREAAVGDSRGHRGQLWLGLELGLGLGLGLWTWRLCGRQVDVRRTQPPPSHTSHVSDLVASLDLWLPPHAPTSPRLLTLPPPTLPPPTLPPPHAPISRSHTPASSRSRLPTHPPPDAVRRRPAPPGHRHGGGGGGGGPAAAAGCGGGGARGECAPLSPRSTFTFERQGVSARRCRGSARGLSEEEPPCTTTTRCRPSL